VETRIRLVLFKLERFQIPSIFFDDPVNICILLHLVGFLLTLNYDARNQELKIRVTLLASRHPFCYTIPASFFLAPTHTGIKSRWTAGFSALVHTGPVVHPAYCTVGRGSFPGVKRPGRGVHHALPSSAEVNEITSVHVLPLWVFLASSRVTFSFAFFLLKHYLFWTIYSDYFCHFTVDFVDYLIIHINTHTHTTHTHTHTHICVCVFFKESTIYIKTLLHISITRSSSGSIYFSLLKLYTTHNHNQAHSKHHTTHTHTKKKHDMLPQHRVNIHWMF